MAGFTIGDFAGALDAIVTSLDDIVGELGHCNPKAEIDNTPGRTAICSVPVVVVERCVAPPRSRFTIADLIETVEGLRDWARDVHSKLGGYDQATPLDAGVWPSSGSTRD